MPVVYNSFSPASLVILAMSSDEELMIAEIVEEFCPYENLDPYEEFGSYEEFDLEFLFFTGGVMRTFT